MKETLLTFSYFTLTEEILAQLTQNEKFGRQGNKNTREKYQKAFKTITCH